MLAGSQKKRKGGIILACLVLCLVLTAAFFVFLLYLFVPGGKAMPDLVFGEGVFGARQNDLKVLVDGQEQTLRVYVANLQPDPNYPVRQQTVLLTGLLLKPSLKSGPETVNWKVGQDYIGATNDCREVFYPGWWGLIAGEGVHATYPLEDSMTGMNAEYTIVDHGPSLDYAVAFPPDKGTRIITFSIPKKLFGIQSEKAPDQNTLHIRPSKSFPFSGM